MTQQLDPSPRNELCKGLLDPEIEQRLLAQGATYAKRVFHPDGKFHLRTATTPINAIAANVLKPPNASSPRQSALGSLAQSIKQRT
jgi:hypothetical protein